MVYRPATPPAPPALFRGASVLTRILLGVDGWTRCGKGRGGDRGVCDPAHYLGTMMVIVCLSFPRGAPRPPESTLAVSPVLESILGVWFVGFCLQHYNVGYHPPENFRSQDKMFLELISLCKCNFSSFHNYFLMQVQVGVLPELIF